MDDREFARQLIQYDPTTLSDTVAMHAVHRPLATIPWPAHMKPAPAKAMAVKPDDPLPRHRGVVIVTWTVEEARALADVLSPGHPSKDWPAYRHQFDSYKPLIRHGAPALEADRLGSYWHTSIGGTSTLLFKSELHMSQDGPQLPVKRLWRQIIEETGCRVLISTGTAGGIGPHMVVGDVTIAGRVEFDCQREFKDQAFAQQGYDTTILLPAGCKADLMASNRDMLPPGKHAPVTYVSTKAEGCRAAVVTTDFFAFGTSTDTFGLGRGGDGRQMVEMGDAVLGMVCQELGDKAPRWTAIRNASDPEIDMTGKTPEQAREEAGKIYMQYGYWSTVNSAIACGLVAAGN